MNHKLDVGAVIRRVFAIYVEQSSVLMPAAAVVFVFTGILSTVLTNAGSGLRLLALLVIMNRQPHVPGVPLVSPLPGGPASLASRRSSPRPAHRAAGRATSLS